MPAKTRVIFIGDVVGSLGRQALKDILPKWQKKYKPDLVVANVENLAHGKGITVKTISEVKKAGVEIMTGGNHIWSKLDPKELLSEGDFALAIPANDQRTPKEYSQQITEVNGIKVAVINLMGKTFMDSDHLENPFHKIDKMLAKLPSKTAVIVDIHAEATSEKMAMGFYLDGRVTAVIGTHTHVPTADARIMDGGTAYITDVGMTGPYPSVLGIKKDIIIDKFLQDKHIKHELPESGQIEINAVLLDVDNKSRKATNIELLRQITD